MAANTSPVFTLTAVSKTAQITSANVANTARDASNGTIVTVLAAGTNGTRIDRITATGTATTLAGQVILYITDGATTWILKELTIAAATASSTVAAATVELVRTDGLPLAVLPTGWSLKAGVTVLPSSGAINITAFGGDY